MHANEQALRDFYAAFDRRDGEAMAALYAPDATFSDPVFPGLRDGEPADMWRMLTGRSADLRVELPECRADDTTGSARWVATYTFGATGRPVVNDVRSTFAFRDGKVVAQTDDFDFWRWSRQALGLPGLLLGWSPLLRGKVRGTARSGLDAFRGAR